jgi:hypothetical protein
MPLHREDARLHDKRERDADAAAAAVGPLVNKELREMLARFYVHDEERESRDVTEQWLTTASANHDNVLLKDGNTYCVCKVTVSGNGAERHARVDLEAPQFARGS